MAGELRVRVRGIGIGRGGPRCGRQVGSPAGEFKEQVEVDQLGGLLGEAVEGADGVGALGCRDQPEVANATAKQVDRLMGETRDQLATDLKAMARREAVKASALGSTLKEALETDLKHATRLFTPEEPMVRPVRH